VATVHELTEPYRNFMLNPLPPGAIDVCRVCLTFTEGYDRCFRCNEGPLFTRAVLPISYSVHFGQLHTALADYKRAGGLVARRFQLQLAAVLWRFVTDHERCLARLAGVPQFDLVTTVPSGSIDRDAGHPLRTMVGSVVQPTRDRYQPLLARSGTPVEPRATDPGKFNPTRDLDGQAVLLIDDTWTTGANVQSAAGALQVAGAGSVGVLVIGRHVHEDYKDNAARLRALPRPFDWGVCAVH
jgi:hypothetical protein